MWKESYRIGVEAIDKQHIELFKMTEELVKMIEFSKGRDIDYVKENCKASILFLKNYAVEHFSDEEQYQEWVQYSRRQEHKKIHQKFIATVLKHEEKMVSSDFSLETVKDFTGTLITWLIHHVAGEDQKIVQKESEIQSEDRMEGLVDMLSLCASSVVRNLTGLRDNEIKTMQGHELTGDISLTINFIGDMKKEIEFVFTEEMALNIFRSMTIFDFDELNDLVRSALSEVVHIICDDVIAIVSKNGLNCHITADRLKLGTITLKSQNSFMVHTSIGDFGLSI